MEGVSGVGLSEGAWRPTTARVRSQDAVWRTDTKIKQALGSPRKSEGISTGQTPNDERLAADDEALRQAAPVITKDDPLPTKRQPPLRNAALDTMLLEGIDVARAKISSRWELALQAEGAARRGAHGARRMGGFGRASYAGSNTVAGMIRSPGSDDAQRQPANGAGRATDRHVLFADRTEPKAVVLTGSPGTGKSHLAVRDALARAARYPGGTYVFTLGHAGPPTDGLSSWRPPAESSASDRWERVHAQLGKRDRSRLTASAVGEP